jgi:hypothetical protein
MCYSRHRYEEGNYDTNKAIKITENGYFFYTYAMMRHTHEQKPNVWFPVKSCRVEMVDEAEQILAIYAPREEGFGTTDCFWPCCPSKHKTEEYELILKWSGGMEGAFREWCAALEKHTGSKLQPGSHQKTAPNSSKQLKTFVEN